MSTLTRAAAWAALVLTATMGLIWGWLPTADLGLGVATDTDRVTSAGAYATTVLTLLAALHLFDRLGAPRRLRLAATLAAVSFTVLASSAALDLNGVPLTGGSLASLTTGATGVLVTPWAFALLAMTLLRRRPHPTRHRTSTLTILEPAGEAA